MPLEIQAPEEETEVQKVQKGIHEALQELKKSLPAIEPLTSNAEGLLVKIRVRSYVIDCAEMPLNKFDVTEMGKRLHMMIDQLEKVPSFQQRPADATVSFSLLSKEKLGCSVAKNGKTQEYVSTAHNSYTVLKKDVDIATPDEKKIGPALQMSARKKR